MDIVDRMRLAYGELQVFTLEVRPKPKPRMVKSDSYRKRSIVTDYWKFKDAIRSMAKIAKLESLPGEIPLIVFYLPIPKNGRVVKKSNGPTKTISYKVFENDPVTVMPDIDNLLKALFDCLEIQDNYIHTSGIAKRYSKNPRIEIYLQKP